MACLAADAKACEYSRFLTDLGQFPWRVEGGLGREMIEWDDDLRRVWAGQIERSLAVLEAARARREASWAEQGPEMSLRRALLDIVNALSLGHFRDLIRERKRMTEAKFDLLNTLAQTHPAEAMEEAARPPRDTFRPAFIGLLRFELRQFERGCERALAALDGGGGQVLNDAMTPGTLRRTVEIGTRIEQARSTASHLRLVIVDPQFKIEDRVGELESHKAWAGQVRDELEAALRQRKPVNGGGAKIGVASATGKVSRAWTKQQLIDATGPSKISPSCFERLRRFAGIAAWPKGIKGLRYSVGEVRLMLDHVEKGAPQNADRIRTAWKALLAARN